MFEDLEEEILCIEKHFNASIGKERERIEGKVDEEPWRNSKEVNNEGKELGLVEDRGWDITNGNRNRWWITS